MSDQWYYLTDGGQAGPIDAAAFTRLAREGTIPPSALVWKDGMPEWRPAVEVRPADFSAAEWLFINQGVQSGPVAYTALTEMARGGQLDRAALAWKPGMAEWKTAGELPGLFAAPPPKPDKPSGSHVPPPVPARSLLGGIGAKISEYTDLPTLSNVPVRKILMGGLTPGGQTEARDIEDEFAVGTLRTTPSLADIPTGWPTARLFWRVLGGSLATYMLMRYGLTQFKNLNFVPGMIVVGSFVVPFSVVVLFFEMNAPRNVSVYQVGKMLMLGGALSLIVTMFVFELIPGSGTGALIPALLTGFCEETGKGLALLIVAYSIRYGWQLNGLLFGAAVGAGFAGFESAGYAFRYLLKDSLDAALEVIWLRGILAPGGHVIWTAMVGSAIWKVKGQRPFAIGMLFDRVVLRRLGAAVVLHGLWDTNVPLLPYQLKFALLVVVGWYIVFAILKEALGNIETAKQSAG